MEGCLLYTMTLSAHSFHGHHKPKRNEDQAVPTYWAQGCTGPDSVCMGFLADDQLKWQRQTS